MTTTPVNNSKVWVKIPSFKLEKHPARFINGELVTWGDKEPLTGEVTEWEYMEEPEKPCNPPQPKGDVQRG